jgi:N-acetyl sugar amidotransferase
MDDSVPDIVFDDSGICNYCKQFDAIENDSPNDQRGEIILQESLAKIKKTGIKNKYDILVGVSGGVDSMYLVQFAVNNGLRVLAVNFDNGWHSEIAVSNIKTCLEKLGVDLITYVVEYDEMKDILLSYLKANIPWVDGPTDLALVATLYHVASKNKIRYIYVGNNFRNEGKQPDSWTHTDSRQIKHIQRRFGNKKLKTFPNLTLFQLIRFGYIMGIKMIRPLNFMRYSKSEAKRMLEKEYGWKDYGGHHHESAFTKFVITYWLPIKFGIDKRKITYSAQIRSGMLDRKVALELLEKPSYNPQLIEEEKRYVIKKLGIDENEFKRIWNLPNKGILDYPSYYPLYIKIKKWANHIFKHILNFKPMMMYDLDT